ncbi:Spherulation-specific family 4-domain-containing protein [Collybia nuda]|uniref:Spherulation-specific family 4-domain-containing protein n=1 Tax=Collybia nuda TaxID=64659 RepID=A0A9P5Y334_9AGAR|nr:Spherulation-specific family 4-domain-containing protein [Collybia nuda]
MLPTLLITQIFLSLYVQSLGIFIPLDVDPGSGTCSGWKQVISSISGNPQTPFFSIVNPNDGPGDHGSQPNTAFQQCVQSLRPRANAIVLGYISIGSKSSSNIQAEVDTYAGWDSPYRPTGILFDGVSSGSSLFNQYENYTTYARRKGFSFIGLDPGEMPDPLYFSIADLVNTYESSYASFNASEDVFDSPSAPISKQSVWLTGAPNTGSYSAVISQIIKKGVAAAYISNLRDDEAGIPIQWSLFVEDVSKANEALDNSTTTETSTTMVNNLVWTLPKVDLLNFNILCTPFSAHN